ncbi:MAG: glycosyltransferase family 4 protein [Cyanosarcina radialis HA8281-LM2]|jgi:glycosyltransferase involved in cell wall biosynthesis|nr:glycosyltransferase family 4 protein [Cyanosarcina radialis HA8281-LM2]
MNNLRIAWLLTSGFYYWHPMLSHLAKIFPQMRAFTAKWRGYAPGFENSFQVQVVGERKIFKITKSATGYGTSFTYLPLSIVNCLMEFQPQVIFANSFGIWTAIALLLKPIGKWKVVIAYEGSSPAVDYRHSPTRLAVRSRMLRMADACITNTKAGRSYLIDILQAIPQKVFVHPYEVPDRESLLKAPETSDMVELPRPIFLFGGSIIPRKGLHLLLEACALLHQQGNSNYSLVVVGDGVQRPELEKFCQEQNLTECVRWIGRVDYDRLGAYFRQADVFVLPTLEDTWALVVLEAMAIGKPVICSRQAGAAELVIDGENGYCFDPNDVKRLAEILSQFIADPQLTTSMGQKSQELIAKYSPEAAAKFLADVTAFVIKK